MKPLDVAFEFADEFYRQRRRGAGVLLNSHHNNIVRLGGFFAGRYQHTARRVRRRRIARWL